MALGPNFYKSCGKDGGKVGENPAALRDAVFSLSSKNLRGAFKRPPPPPSRARVNTHRGGGYESYALWKEGEETNPPTKEFRSNRTRNINLGTSGGDFCCLFIHLMTRS